MGGEESKTQKGMEVKKSLGLIANKNKILFQ